MEIILRTPLYVHKCKDKKWYLNLNNYRNTHFLTLSIVKKVFTESVYSQMEGIPFIDYPIKLTYKIYPASKRLFDVSNVCSIIDKFFCDALTTHNKLIDDSYQIVQEVVYKVGEIDRDNPRCEITIQSIKPEPMDKQ